LVIIDQKFLYTQHRKLCYSYYCYNYRMNYPRRHARVAASISALLFIFVFFTPVAHASTINISTCTQLQNIGSTTGPLSGSYALTQNVDCTATANFSPIGDFTGTFNGAGFTISNLHISTTTSNVGLFSILDATSTVENLTLSGGSVSGGTDVGALAGEMLATSTVQNVTSTIPVADTGGYIGGLVGNGNSANATIASSSASGAVTSSGNYMDYIGGLVGQMLGPISNSSASAPVTVTGTDDEYIGGLAGYTDSLVSNSYATGNVNASTQYNYSIGGLIGESNAPVTNTYATGSVTGGYESEYLGGLIGENSSGNIASSSATGVVTGGYESYYCGGFAGYTYGVISNSFATGNVIGTSTAEDFGGFVGAMESGSITQSYSTGNVYNANEDVGGFVGFNNYPITQSFSTGNLYLNGDSYVEYAGGFAGYTEAATTNDYETGSITIDSTPVNNVSYVGGFTGYTGGPVTNVYSTGAINGPGSYSDIGGFVGYNEEPIVNSFSVGGGTGLTSTTSGSVGYFIGDELAQGPLTNVAEFVQGTPAIGEDNNNSGSAADALLATHGYGTDESTLANFYLSTEPVYAQASSTPWNFSSIWTLHANALPTFQWYSGVTPTYTITATAGTGGQINNAGAFSVLSGANQTYNIIPSSGYTIASVLVDGTSVGAVSTYTFTNVTANHTIAVTFTATVTTPTPTQTSGGGSSGGGTVSNQISNLLTNGNAAAAAALAQQYNLSLPSGTATTANTASVSTTACTAALYPTKPIKLGAQNDPAQVKFLEEYLNTYDNANLPVTGVYSAQDEAAVIAWQEKYASVILTPWHLTKGTGYVYTTSLTEFKNLFNAECESATSSSTSTQSTTTQAAPPSTTVRDLELGMSGDDVKALQQALIAKDTGAAAQALAKNGATGYFGALTKAALIEYQKASGITPAEGYYGSITRTYLSTH
jgi:peptidoglycan hydrolase-like protein with peptidoglycan-binding domain